MLGALLLHIPYVVLVWFILAGLVERIGYWVLGRKPRHPGTLPARLPRVCIQLPMFNEQLVAARAIQSACALDWPKDKLEVQVLDDSSEERARAIVDEAVAVQQSLGMNCYVVRREERTGYKAGALEHARKLTTAPYLALFDADFVPQASFLLAILPHFYTKQGELLEDLALVQAQWGHLNPCCSSITMAQSLWIDDHHTLQMNWFVLPSAPLKSSRQGVKRDLARLTWIDNARSM